MTDVVVRARQAALCLLLVVVAFHQSAGLIGNDTKLDLTADPARFLDRALDLWNPSSAFGQLQNQAYGYLWPMGPFHLLGTWLGVPGWVVQRSWMALLLITAFLGVLRLAARLELGTPHTRLLGGMFYALAPRVLTEIGGNSSEILPVALLPWVLIPLVGRSAEERPRQAAMRSGVAVLCMGAVNATAVLALLPLPGLWLLPGLARAAGRRLAAWWLLAVMLACTWWFVPLVLQGHYTPRFLDYIETAATTTGTTSVSEVLRGTTHWLGYVAVGGQPWWRSGWTLVTAGGVVLVTAVVSLLCVAGLIRGRMPGRGRLITAGAVGLLAMSAGHAGPLHGVFDVAVRSWLDGALAPFRNVHKFDALVRLPLALGMCHLLGLAPTGRPRAVLAGLVTVGLIGSASPALAGQLVPSGGYDALPSWWTAAGHWLDDNPGGGRALVVPARGFGEYSWGRPLDDPLQALTRTPYAVRDAVPLGSPGLTRLLDAVGTRLDTGVGSPALAQVLARSGVSYLVVSNDLEPRLTGVPRAVLVHQALLRSPGVTRVASFGPTVGGDDTRAVVSDDGLHVGYPAVEIFAVAGSTGPVSSIQTAATWRVSGGPEALFALGERGLLGDHATVLAGDGPVGPTPRSAMTDSLRRREITFGRVRDNATATLTASAQLTRQQSVPDILPIPGVEHLATAELVGAESVTASSSTADPDALFGQGPSRQPSSAFDGDPATAWVAAGRNPWVQVVLAAPLNVTGLTITPLHESPVLGFAPSVTVRTDQGSRRTALTSQETPQTVNVAAGPTRSLRVTVETAGGFGSLVGLREVSVPALTVQTTIALPQDQSLTADPVVLLDRAAGARAACVDTPARSVCSGALSRPGEDVVRLDRTFTLSAATPLPAVGAVVPVPGPALDALLDRGSAVQVTASSRLVADPRGRPATVADGDLRTGWIADDADKAPALSLSWAQPRTVTQVRLVTDDGLPAARPTQVAIDGRAYVVPRNGVLTLRPITATRLTLTVTAWEKRLSFGLDGSARRLPVGVSELSVAGLRRTAPSPSVRLACGQGPPIVVDGTVHPTAVLGTRTDLLSMRPMLLSVCDPPVQLAAGRNRVSAAERAGFQVQSLTLGNPLPSVTEAARPTTVRHWDAEHRVVRVGAGGETYLVVHENANSGWRATLDGRQLATARLDGWQQAWVVPSGAGGEVRLDFLPGRTFHLALLLGAMLVMVLLALAVLPGAVRTVTADPDLDLPRWSRCLLALGTCLLLGGMAGAVCFVVVAGVGVLARGQVRDNLAGIYGTALALAGVLTALAPWAGSRPPAALGAPVQLLALVGVAAIAVSVSVLPSSSDVSTPRQDVRPAGNSARRRQR